ncbi:MAG: tRNA (adenosine(37)-N6)-threonylcarbamoyltransferase complex dimerization subunit type 1 TsaB [Cyclobacteriaceae bacterium]|nr:tRNA (adenosine(37)-N6)-threonylcarbamoyltransferase complex dimerization subunit type 1 TsaB [Cyclobacteriaceae bacterium]
MAILCLETSAKVCSVALHANGRLITSAEAHVEQSHATRLAPLIDDIVKLSKTDFTQVQAVAVSAGPGSYTGLRIGVSLAKGLCFALKIPLIAINTLELLAYQVRNQVEEDILLCPMIDARRMEVYCMVVNNAFQSVQPIMPKVIDSESFSNFLDVNQILFFGDGAPKCKGVIHHSNALFLDKVYPQASKMGELAYQKFESGQVEDLESFEPVYLKEFMIKPARQS